MPEDPKAYKSQPWMLFDTIAAKSFLMGDGTQDGLAIGTQTPAISASGEMVFFATGRNAANMPWYTNMQQTATLAYGFEVWAVALELLFPTVCPQQNDGYSLSLNPGVAAVQKLAECIINFGVLELELGQENQISWPCSKFGPGGGLSMSGNDAAVNTQSGERSLGNMLKLAEPIEMPRTQALNAKIRIAPEVHALIGNTTNIGVGKKLAEYDYTYSGPTTVDYDQPPYAVRLTLSGRRIKRTQYGQVPQGA